jgi:hypothetical protein
MNRDKTIALTNKLAFILITLLVYWVFIFISITVFGFKVFRENITQTFFTSILAILALLGGAVVLNIMLNLTKMADVLSGLSEQVATAKPGRPLIRVILFWLSFPLLFGLLYLGDYRTSLVKRDLLLKSAQAIISENVRSVNGLGYYQYDLAYFKQAESALELFKNQDENLNSIQLIHEDSILGKQVFLQFSRLESHDALPEKTGQIHACSREEREYLRSVFNGRNSQYRFSSRDGHYELYYPVKTPKRVMVFYFTDYQRYGKFGS